MSWQSTIESQVFSHSALERYQHESSGKICKLVDQGDAVTARLELSAL
jgi:hypothetical protein